MTFESKYIRHLTISVGCLYLIIYFMACQNGNMVANPYKFTAPENFPAPTYTFYNNSVTEEGFKLGKKLFFDPILSIDGSISCSSCHNQSFAFADLPLHPVSIGIDGLVGTRNAPAVVACHLRNVVWARYSSSRRGVG